MASNTAVKMVVEVQALSDTDKPFHQHPDLHSDGHHKTSIKAATPTSGSSTDGAFPYLMPELTVNYGGVHDRYRRHRG